MAGTTLITGLGGLIGTWVRRAWTPDDGALVGVERPTTDLLVPGAATELVRRVRPARIVHLAWSASGTPGYRTSPDNDAWLRATLELVRAADDLGALTWVTGTAVDTDGSATDGYSTAKRELRAALRDSIDSARLGWLRPFYVFDPTARRPEVVAAAVAARDAGRAVTLRTPYASHDFVHAADVGSAVVAAVRHDLRGIVEIGSGTLRTVAEVVTALGAAWGSEGGGAPSEVGHHELAADCGRLRAAGWLPTMTEEFFAA